jgi:hypothetical protein
VKRRDVSEAQFRGQREQSRRDAAITSCPVIANRHSYFLRRERNLHYWNVTSGVLEMRAPVDDRALDAALRKLIDWHDGLRLRAYVEGGEWLHEVVEPASVGPIVTVAESRTSDEGALRQVIEERICELQGSFSFPGDLFKVLHVRDLHRKRSFLCVIAHHLIADAYSFNIVLDDLFGLYRQKRLGECAPLQAQTASFLEYSARTTAYWARHAGEQAGYWRSLPFGEVAPVPVERELSGDSNTEQHTVSCVESVPTRALYRASTVWPHRFVDLLLAAVAVAYRRWTGDRVLLLANVFHGRACGREDVDVSRTVGWISEAIPLLLRPTLPAAALLEDTHRQVHRANTEGKGYGVVRYLMPDTPAGRTLMALPEPQVSLNIKVPSFRRRTFTDLAREEPSYSVGPVSLGTTQRVFLLSGGAWFSGGRFHLAWDFSAKVFAEDTIRRFTRQCLEELMRAIERSATDRRTRT